MQLERDFTSVPPRLSHSLQRTRTCNWHLSLPPQGSYSLPPSDFYLPHVDLPYWLTNGNYRVQGVLGSQGKELGCLQVSLSIHSN